MIRKIRIVIGIILYYGLAKHLPQSHAKINLCSGKIRHLCGTLILDYCGKDANIERNAVFTTRCTLGKRSSIGINAKLGDVYIGNDVMMGPNCVILTRNHAFDRTDIPMIDQGYTEPKPVTIEDDVWIGQNVIILPGRHIGKGAIIGGGSVVTHDVQEYDIVAGNPAKRIKNRKSD